MNFLILINNAPNYKRFYSNIGQQLEAQGHKVFFAITSKRLRTSDPDSYIDNSANCFYFDEYFDDNRNKEIKFVPNLTWGELFYSDFDRFFTHKYNLDKSSDYWYSIASNLANYFRDIINRNNIDCILYENVSNSFAYAAYQAAIDNNIIYLGLMASRLPNRYEIQSSIFEESDYIEELALSLQIDSNDTGWCKSYLENLKNTQPDYMSNNPLNESNKLKKLISPSKLNTAYKYIKLGFDKNSNSDYQTTSPLQTLKHSYIYNVNKYINEHKSEKYLISGSEVDELIEKDKGNFYVYPTHYHPESSTSVLAPYFTDEFNNILNIHNSLAIGTYLYVKDHISARGIKSENFYKKISALPGVRIIHYSYNTKELVIKSKGVISITSTVGYEAALLGKPVYLLGRVFYEKFPNVVMLENFQQLKIAVNQEFKRAPTNKVYKYLIAYKRYTYEGQLLIDNRKQWPTRYFLQIATNIENKVHELKKNEQNLIFNR